MRSRFYLVALALAAACGSAASSSTAPSTGPSTTPTATTSVSIAGFAFAPAAIQVSPGAVVSWTNSDNTNHTVTFSDASVGATAAFASGSKTLSMPSVAGTYAYHCSIHPAMTGTVEVK
jgi:plastocyanin